MPGGAGREDYSPMPTGGSGANYSHSGTGDGQHVKTKTTHGPKKKTTTGDGLSGIHKLPSVRVAKYIFKGGKKILGNIFQKKAKVPTVEDTAAMEDAPFHQQKKMYDWGPQNGGGGNVTTATQSLVTAPTADKAAGFGHQWDFKAYGNTAQATANPYDYTKSPYAKKGKLVRKYATGQEIKNFSKGKRFGPPPLKGPDPQGLQVILENSDYFKKLIG